MLSIYLIDVQDAWYGWMSFIIAISLFGRKWYSTELSCRTYTVFTVCNVFFDRRKRY